jgi:methyl acetate hydrolase
MKPALKEAADRVLRDAVENKNNLPGAPGIVAMATDRQGNFYEGAAGKRELGKDSP